MAKTQLPKSIAGVAVPDTALALAAAELAASVSPRFLYNHCARTYVFSGLLFEKLGAKYDRELAFIASMLHDLGLVDEFMTPAGRFEVDGADAAVRFLRERDVAPERADIVWDAIALHTSIGITDRKAPEIAAVHIGAGLDVVGLSLDQISREALEQVLDALPRLGFKEAFTDLFVALCRKKPAAQVGQFTADFGRRHIDGFACPTIEDLMHASPLAD